MREIIIGGIVFLLAAMIFAVRPRNIIGVTARSVTVPVSGTVTLIHVGWFGRNPGPVPGSVTPTSRPTLFVTAPASGTSGASPVAMTITGVVAGTGTITLNGVAADGTIHNSEDVAVTVTGG